MDIRSAFSKKLAGLPVWVWALVIAGGILAYAYITDSGDDGPSTVDDPGAAYPDGSQPGDAGDIEGTPSTPERTVPITTNPAWIRYVTDRMVAAGEDPIEVSNALTKGLAGLRMTQREAALWRLAVQRYGPPPEGAPPLDVDPLPQNPPPSTAKPVVVFWNGKPTNGGARWALAGKTPPWQETTSQWTANAWAKQYMPGGDMALATPLYGAAWDAKKAEYTS